MLPYGNRSATTYRGHVAAGYGSCGRLGTQGISPVRRGAIEKKKSGKSLDTERAVVDVQGRV